MISDLCTYSHLCDKHDSRGGRDITRITPHHMSGRHTGEWCADYFCSTTRKSSANYCIGYDGDIAACVDEDYRAWTSSSWENDSRAITVELSDISADSSVIPDATVEAFVRLCVDLLKRYPSLGGSLRFTGDEEGNVTFHKWFHDTDCPGWWIEEHIGEICAEVNRQMKEDTMLDWVVVKPREGSDPVYLLASGKWYHIPSGDSWTAVEDFYRQATGEEIPYIKDFGSERACWDVRLLEVFLAENERTPQQIIDAL